MPDEDKTFSDSLVLDLRINDVTCTHSLFASAAFSAAAINWCGSPLNNGKGFSKVSKPTEQASSALH